MFNEVRVYCAQPVRVWAGSEERNGHWVIFPNGIMRWAEMWRIEAMPLANAEQAANAFPVQDVL